MQRGLWLVVLWLVGALAACQSNPMFRSSLQDKVFQQRYLNQPWYTAMVLRPYRDDKGYVVDLSGRIAEEQFATYRSGDTVTLGTPITLTGVENQRLLARLEGYDEPFQILLAAPPGSPDAVAKELSLLLSKTPPLSRIRPEMRLYVERGQIARGMSWKEVYMSWGLPDKTQALPGSSSVLEEWIYFNQRMHLYLENGHVTNWQVM